MFVMNNPRFTSQQKQLVIAQQQSGLSVTEYCRQQDIKYNAFYYCSNLVSVFWNAKSCSSFSSCPFPAAKIMSFTFGEDVVTIPAYLCYKMTTILLTIQLTLYVNSE